MSSVQGRLARLAIVGFVAFGVSCGFAHAEAIKIGPIIRALDGPLAPIACASRTAFQPCEDCDDLDTCPVRLIMTDVRDAMSQILDATTLADLAKRTSIGGLGLDTVL